MDNQIDVSKINDLAVLKAMAYDAIAEKERADGNLRLLNARIAEVLDDAVASTERFVPDQS